MKKIIVCCDGTWDRPNQSTDGHACPSNVEKLYRALAPVDQAGVKQLAFYVEGVGVGTWDRFSGGAFGVGLSHNVRTAYKDIAENYESGDEIFLVGFSRGAFTARSTAGFIRDCGLLRPENMKMLDEAYGFYRDRSDDTNPRSEAAQNFRAKYAIEAEPRIRCIAVWDTVGALGIPLNGLRWVNVLNRPWQFHDTKLSTKVDFAFQALAIDEKRNSFEPTLWQQQEDADGQHLEQVWFAGTHADVGGGNEDASLADVPLMWIVQRLESLCGVAFKPDGFPSKPPAQYLTRPNPLAQLTESRTGFWRLLPPYLRPLRGGDHEWIASTAKRRYERDDNYSPANLIPHIDDPNAFVQIGPFHSGTTTTVTAPVTQLPFDPAQVDKELSGPITDQGKVEASGDGDAPLVPPSTDADETGPEADDGTPRQK